MKRLVKSNTTILKIAIVVSLFCISCNQNAYVVLSDRVVMNTKDGMAYPISLDSTYHVYDHIRISKSGEVTPIRSGFKSQ